MGPVYWVGPAALEALREHAGVWAAALAIEAASHQAGTFDDVHFDEETARAALELANEASAGELVEGGIEPSAAERIVAGRPYASLAEVAISWGIDGTTLRALRDLAAESTACEPALGSTDEPSTEAYGAALHAIDPRPLPEHTRLSAFSAAACLDVTRAEHVDLLRAALIEHAGWGWVAADFPDRLEGGELVTGTEPFLTQLDRSFYDTAAHCEASPEPPAECEGLAARHQALRAWVAASPETSTSMALRLDAGGSPDVAALVVDPSRAMAVAIYVAAPSAFR
jgi:hypothetical protein